MTRTGHATATLVVHVAVTGAVGLLAMRLAGAPASALIVQVGALALGSLLAMLLWFKPLTVGRTRATVGLAVCLALVLPTLAGGGMEGVRRWIALGPLTIQPASIVLPFALLAWTATPPSLWTAGLTSALALILALQPDAASATGLALGLIGSALVRRRPGAAEAAAIACAVASAIWAWTRVDPLPAVAYVERVIVTAFAASPVIGATAGVLLCLLPAPFIWTAARGGPQAEARVTAAALAGLWIGLVAANLQGSYPAPMLGYGASLALGWLASLGMATSRVSAEASRTR